MIILLSSLAVAFAALCVWLTVRIVNRRERWAKWMLAAVTGLPVLYVASFGPACWIASHSSTEQLQGVMLSDFYLPIGWTMDHSPQFVVAIFRSYATLGMKEWSVISIGTGPYPRHSVIWGVRRERTVNRTSPISDDPSESN